MRAKKKNRFPDLNKDGKVTRADILKGRGVFKNGGKVTEKLKKLEAASSKSEPQIAPEDSRDHGERKHGAKSVPQKKNKKGEPSILGPGVYTQNKKKEPSILGPEYKKGGKVSRVNEAGNYTKPSMRKRLFNQIKAGSKGGRPGQWSARKAQLLAQRYKKSGGGYTN